MKWLANALLLAIWLVIATFLYAMAWSHYPDVFPDYPEWVADVIGRLTTDPQMDDVESLATNYYLILSFLPVAAATALALLVRRLLRRRASRR
ncbi:hypothetical protein D3C81_1973820 [compost metagenome]|uniref:Transmembrane protein n=1 Tax=Cupriavidus campinensis TaxID=151783 RepID=A0AAE9HXQ3_9BURK|nr:hypothetical protein [Cupriavidus campinensis]TSP12536.1 hypothetical protein FGG12_13200 [Cupriavidus campinensis]URF03279.1 hypothetical protein M5D45_12125 [Cupriavidus campinensis]